MIELKLISTIFINWKITRSLHRMKAVQRNHRICSPRTSGKFIAYMLECFISAYFSGLRSPFVYRRMNSVFVEIHSVMNSSYLTGIILVPDDNVVVLAHKNVLMKFITHSQDKVCTRRYPLFYSFQFSLYCDFLSMYQFLLLSSSLIIVRIPSKLEQYRVE